MHVIRPIRLEDHAALAEFAFTPTLGLTNLPKNEEKLLQIIQKSIHSFGREVSAPGNEHYYFILEDIEAKQAVGVCAIVVKIGAKSPSYFYKITPEYFFSNKENKEIAKYTLNPITISNGPSEICAIFLMPTARKAGLGRLLSLSRLLFIASHPHRFQEEVIAEMRGIIREDFSSPFYEGLGCHFCDLSFQELMYLLDRDRTIIPKIIPKHPIYLSLLPKETQESVGKTHAHTSPAFQILREEGFQLTDDIDIFDGGPKLSAPRGNIRTIKNNKLGIIQEITTNEIDSPLYVICNTFLDYRACLAKLKFVQQEITISKDTADTLNVKKGDFIRYIIPHSEQIHPLLALRPSTSLIKTRGNH